MKSGFLVGKSSIGVKEAVGKFINLEVIGTSIFLRCQIEETIKQSTVHKFF
jgi:hypothetical protein